MSRADGLARGFLATVALANLCEVKTVTEIHCFFFFVFSGTTVSLVVDDSRLVKPARAGQREAQLRAQLRLGRVLGQVDLVEAR